MKTAKFMFTAKAKKASSGAIVGHGAMTAHVLFQDK